MNKVLVSANYEGYESKNINFTELNNVVKERFENVDQEERKKRADKFNQKFEVTRNIVDGHLREIIVPKRLGGE
ncbi:TPA_asm: hypothetical protein GYW94_08105 [Listeria monocytogenes]|nr:hypothetical protein [Listeria monocytogenes]HAC2586248.1 hypothetical protein [Listeria monocytogenes]